MRCIATEVGPRFASERKCIIWADYWAPLGLQPGELAAPARVPGAMVGRPVFDEGNKLHRDDRGGGEVHRRCW